MYKNLVLVSMLFMLASCHHDTKHSNRGDGAYHIRFSPPDSSTYHYNTLAETIITVTSEKDSFTTRRTSEFSVNYLVSKDSNEVMLEMTFDKLDYHEKNGFGASQVDVAETPGPARELLKRMKKMDIFVRVNPTTSLITLGGVQEIVDQALDPFYPEADRSQAKAYWGYWAEQQLVWKNLDPFVWVSLDSVRHPDGHWTDTSSDAEEINFKINKRFQFDTVNGGEATIRSQGSISNDKAGTWLSGKTVTGPLTGTESGKYLIDTATGMPAVIDDMIIVDGDVKIEGRKARIKILKTIIMEGGKSK